MEGIISTQVQNCYGIIIYSKCVVVSNVDPGILLLEIASGLKDSLITAGFTIESILSLGPSDLSCGIRNRTVCCKDYL